MPYLYSQMETAHIYIYGEIGYFQDSESDSYGVVNLSTVKRQHDAQAASKDITVHIHSNGGYVLEGFAIHDYLRSLGKPITTIVEGMCYSIATVIALAGDKRIMTSNSDFMIHNPWGMEAGESSDMRKAADELEKLETKAAKFYASKTRLSEAEALTLMKAETFMTGEEALKNGFITEIASTMKAVALYKKTKNKTMSVTKEELDSSFASFGKMIKKMIGGKKSLMLQNVKGVSIEFPDLEEGQSPSVGDKGLVEGVAAEGEHTRPDGTVYVFEAGKVSEVKEPEEQTAEIDALNAKLAKKKEQYKAAKAQFEAEKLKNKASQAALVKMNAEFEKLKKMSGEYVPGETKPDPKKKKEASGKRSL